MRFADRLAENPRWMQTLCAALLLIAALQNVRHPVMLDDAYITFRCAANFADGQGLLFNPGEQVLSTTAPGYAIVLAGLHRFGLDIVLASKLFSAVMLFAGALALMGVARRAGRWEAGFGAGIFLCLFPPLMASWGNECVTLLGLFCLGWFLHVENKPALCAVVMTLGCCVRPDFALPALIFGAYWLASDRKSFAIYAALGVALSAPWLGYMHREFGSFAPHTLGVKMMQGEWIAAGDPRAYAGWMTFAQGARAFAHQWLMTRTAGAFALFGGLLALRCRALNPVFVWAGLHCAVYFALKVPGHYFWYYYPLWLCVGVGTGAAIAQMAAWTEARPDAAPFAPAAVSRAAFVLGLSIFCALNCYVDHRDEWAENKFAAYNAMAAKIRELVPAGASVMMNEIGQMGYLGERRVVDTHGLIHDLPGRESVNNHAALVAERRPDFIVEEGWLASEPPDYAVQVRLGRFRRVYDLPGGERVRYEQAARAEGGSTHLPVLLRLVVSKNKDAVAGALYP